MNETKHSVSLEKIYKAQQSIKGVVQTTPLVFMKNFSERYQANIYFKREDLQVVRKPILETLQVDELRPPSEYRTIRWDQNPYQAIDGNPALERDPVYWLLPYWMGRHLELIK